VVASFPADLTAAGVGDPTVRKTLAFLQGVLQRAVEWRRIDSNPAKGVRKPPQRRTRVVDLPSAAAIEQMRATLRAQKRMRDATLVCVLAYAGLRSGDALALEWRHIRERTILVEQALAFGEVKETKTGQTRTGPIVRSARGRPRGVAAHISPPQAEVARLPWQGRKALPTRCIGTGDDGCTGRRLRLPMTLSTYGHVIEELEGAERRSAEAVVRAAREAATPARHARRGN
jgi:integrase